MGTWLDMERIAMQSKVSSIGLSNFEFWRPEEVCEAAAIKPAVMQASSSAERTDKTGHEHAGRATAPPSHEGLKWQTFQGLR